MLSEQALFAFGLGAILQASGLLNFSIGVLTGVIVCYYSGQSKSEKNSSETSPPQENNFLLRSIPSFFLSYFSSKK